MKYFYSDLSQEQLSTMIQLFESESQKETTSEIK